MTIHKLIVYHNIDEPHDKWVYVDHVPPFNTIDMYYEVPTPSGIKLHIWCDDSSWANDMPYNDFSEIVDQLEESGLDLGFTDGHIQSKSQSTQG